MQLDKIANYHRALGDITRLKIVFLLNNGEMHGQALAEQLQVSPPTITHHMTKLREASLVESRREKNTIYFKLIDQQFINYAKASMRLIDNKDNSLLLMPKHDVQHYKYEQSVLKAFFTEDGKLKSIPAKYKKKLIVLEKLISEFEPGKRYSEQEVNEKISTFCDDVATIRREFIMQSFMNRDNDIYEVNLRQLWVKWQLLK